MTAKKLIGPEQLLSDGGKEISEGLFDVEEIHQDAYSMIINEPWTGTGLEVLS